MTGWENIFVGGVSIAMGAIALSVAVTWLDWAAQLPKVQSLQRQWGKTGTRIFFAVLGLALISAGCAVITGFAPGWLGMIVLWPLWR